MWSALNLRQEVACALVAAFGQGRTALSGMDLAEALEQRGLVVEYPTVTAILEGLETRGCVRLLRASGEVLVAEIYPPISHFLGGALETLPAAALLPVDLPGGLPAPAIGDGTWPWTWR
jgi:hypothetical protein